MMEMPKFVQIEPVGQCNLRCRMCSIQFRADGPPHGPLAFIDFELFTRLVDQFVGAEELHLQGLGEPLMHPRFAEMVRYAKARGLRVTTNSNMTILNARRAAELVASKLDCLHVSIDGATAETYERIRLRARLAHVVRNLKLLVQAKQSLASETPRLRMVVVIMRQNLAELPALVRFAHKHGFEAVFVQHLCHDYGEAELPERYLPMRDFTQSQTLLDEDAALVESSFTEARAVAAQLDLELRLPQLQPRAHPPDTPGPERCDWPWRGAYLSYQGLAMPCCMISTPDRLNFGSMAEAGVTAVWNGPDYEEFRQRLSSDNPPEVCRSCSIYSGTF
jgi:MoaA/NifB/PqqE/SkfB family radical SAM enzyme